MYMYTKHFSLNILPFENVPDPLFFYDYGDHARIRKQITGSLQSGRGLIIVTGPIGSGKTTLSQMIKSDFPDNIQLVWMAEPPANSADLYLFLAQELGLQPSSPEKTFVMRDIRNALLQINSEGSKFLVIMDESHLMSDDVINGVRLLNNLEEGSIKLIQLLLLGQEELMEKINRPEMEPFKQRIAALEVLGRMNPEVIRQYITHRIQVAGGTAALISDTGWEALSIAFNSGGGGTPRTINSLCDKSFHVAFERGKSVVDAQDIYEATQRLGLRTDVFHYIVSLNTRKRQLLESQALFEQQSKTEEPVVKTTSLENEQAMPSSLSKALETEQNSKETLNKPSGFSRRDPDLSINGSDAPEIKSDKVEMSSYNDIAMAIKAKYDQKSLKLPLLFLLLSLATFMSSIIFFCHRADSAGFIGCLADLFSF